MEKADVSRNQEMCHVIHIFFGSFLGKVKLCQVSALHDVWQLLGRGVFLSPTYPPSVSSPKKACIGITKFYRFEYVNLCCDMILFDFLLEADIFYFRWWDDICSFMGLVYGILCWEVIWAVLNTSKSDSKLNTENVITKIFVLLM